MSNGVPTWTCPRCGTVHSIYSMTCNCPAPSVATDSTDYVFDLRPMKSERINFADRIAQLEADNAALRAALHEVEWDAHCHCPWCGVQMGKRHRPTCQRQSALGLSVKG